MIGVLGGSDLSKISGLSAGPNETFLGVLAMPFTSNSRDAIRFSLLGVSNPHSILSDADSVAVESSSAEQVVVVVVDGFKMEGSSIMTKTLLGVEALLGDLPKNAGKGTGLGDTSNLESLSARFGVNNPRDDSSASAFLLALGVVVVVVVVVVAVVVAGVVVELALLGVDKNFLKLGDGMSASDRISGARGLLLLLLTCRPGVLSLVDCKGGRGIGDSASNRNLRPAMVMISLCWIGRAVSCTSTSFSSVPFVDVSLSHTSPSSLLMSLQCITETASIWTLISQVSPLPKEQ